MISGYIYFDDKPFAVEQIPEMHIESNKEDEKGPVSYIHPDSHECLFNVQLPYKKARKMCLSLIYGIPITNNWLKMHGGIMLRKVSRNKRSL